MEANISEKLFLAQLVKDQGFFTKIRRRNLSPNVFQDRTYRIIFRHMMEMTYRELSLDLLKNAISRDFRENSITLKIATAKAVEVFATEVESPYSVKMVLDHAKMIELREIIADTVEAATTTQDVDRAIEIASRIQALKEEAYEAYELYQYNTVEAWNDRESERFDRIVNPSRVLHWNRMIWNKEYMPFGQPSNTIIGFSAQTGVGKSVHIGNYVWEAASPPNSLNTLLVIAENRYIETGSRLDSILLGMPYDELRERSTENETGSRFFETQDDWGHIFVVKCVPTKFSAATIADMIEQIRDEHGVEIECLAVDSPDHMRTIERFTGESYQKLGQIYWELKAVVDMYDLVCAVTAQLNRSAGGKDGKGKRKAFTPEDIGKSYELVQILDGLFIMFTSAADRLKGIVRGVWGKGRDFKIDGKTIEMELNDSLRFTLYSEVGVEDGSDQIVKRPPFKGVKYRLQQRKKKYEQGMEETLT